MRRILLFFLALLVAGIATYAMGHFNPPLSLQIAGWVVETRTAFALGVLLLVFLLFWALLKLLFLLFTLPERWQRLRLARGQRLGLASLQVAADEYAGQRFRRAGLLLTRASRILPDPGLSLAMEGWLAMERGDHRTAQNRFNALARLHPHSALAARGLIQSALERKDRVLAQALLQEWLKKLPANPWLLATSFRLQAGQEQWEAAMRLLDALERTGDRQPRRRALCRLMLGRAKAELDRLSEARQLLQQAMKEDPGNPLVHLQLGELLVRLNKADKALALWRAGFLKSGFPPLLQRITRHFAELPLKGVAYLEEMHALQPDNLLLNRTLARLCLAARMWGRARELIQKSGATDAPEVLLLQAEMGLRQEPDKRAEGEGRGPWVEIHGLLLRALSGLDRETWHCQGCHAESDVWRPVCPACGQWDALAWKG